MSQLFDKIKVGSVKSSTFDLSHNQITTSDFGYLVPICYRDMVPNDHFTVKHDLFTRLAPLAVPTFTPGPIKVRVHNFFVPYRILFPHWDAFITQDPNNNYIPPYLKGDDINQWVGRDQAFTPGQTQHHRGYYTRLMGNLGLNPSCFQGQDAYLEDMRFSMFPFLAYYRIWIDWFMDSSIEDHTAKVAAFNEMIKDGGDLAAYYEDLCLTRYACFKKDYFTTARQSPQSGDASKVAVDIAGSDLNSGLYSSATSTYSVQKTGNASKVFLNNQSSSGNSVIGEFTIEALRAANSLQKWLEKNNFVGTKLINRMLAHFGVAPSPERLDMSEFIGGSEFPIEIGDVTSTSFKQGEDDYMGLGAQSGKGWGRGRSNEVTYHAKEHGIFMSLMSILPDTGYYQGISRFWQKGVTGDALDYFTPEFENLGFQEVLNKELYVPDGNSQYTDFEPDGILAFQPRYAEYKFQQDILGGDFLTASTTPTGFNLDSWHLFRKLFFDSENPIALNKNLVECDNHNNDFDRIFQSTDNEYDHFYFMIKSDVKATRPMDGFAAPSLDNANEGDGKMVNLPYGGTRL